jgi:hypothetical protein
LTVRYILLLTTNMSTQTLGQFLPPTVAWGVPPFAAATQSIEIRNRGALVIDVSAKGTVVWRGVAQDDIRMDADDERRRRTLREAARDLMRRFPPRK